MADGVETKKINEQWHTQAHAREYLCVRMKLKMKNKICIKAHIELRLLARGKRQPCNKEAKVK